MRTRLLIPAALAALALLASACGGLGPDELPEEIGSDEREEIAETLEAFFEGVNLYNPEVASEAMLPPVDFGRAEVLELVVEIGQLEGLQSQIGFTGLGPASLEPAELPERVEAFALTDRGEIPFTLVRRNGRWRISSVGDITREAVSDWAVELVDLSTFVNPNGQVIVMGQLENVGSELAVLPSIWIFVYDGSSLVHQEQVGFFSRGVLRPGERMPFSRGFATATPVQADSSFVIRPTASRLDERDLDTFADGLMTEGIAVVEASGAAAQDVRFTLRNASLQGARDVRVALAGYEGSDLTLFENLPVIERLGPGEAREMSIAVSAGRKLPDDYQLHVWGVRE